MKKQAKRDFTINDLPQNRQDIFVYSIRERFSLLLKIGFLLLVFSIPLLVADFIMTNISAEVGYGLGNGLYDYKQAADIVYRTNNTFNLIYTGCYVFLALGASGIMRVVRQLVWGEGVFFFQDFFDGIKSNGLLYSVVAFLIGAIVFLQGVVFNFGETNAIITAISLAAELIIGLPIVLYVFAEIVVYKNKFHKYFIVGMLLYIKTVPKALLIALIFSLGYFISFIPNYIVKYLLFFVYIIFVCPMLLVGWFLTCCSVFDKHINASNYPEIFRKGLYGFNEENNDGNE